MQAPGDEETLVERARRGDPAAFEALVLAYQSLAFRTAFVIAGDATDAEEAAQDGFVKAHRALGRFRLETIHLLAGARTRRDAGHHRGRCADELPGSRRFLSAREL